MRRFSFRGWKGSLWPQPTTVEHPLEDWVQPVQALAQARPLCCACPLLIWLFWGHLTPVAPPSLNTGDRWRRRSVVRWRHSVLTLCCFSCLATDTTGILSTTAPKLLLGLLVTLGPFGCRWVPQVGVVVVAISLQLNTRPSHAAWQPAANTPAPSAEPERRSAPDRALFNRRQLHPSRVPFAFSLGTQCSTLAHQPRFGSKVGSAPGNASNASFARARAL